VKRKLLSPHNGELDKSILSYRTFANEHGHLVHIKWLKPLLVYKYLGFGDTVSYRIENDKLHCETICGFTVIIPLQK
jgi:hypothetical protein